MTKYVIIIENKLYLMYTTQPAIKRHCVVMALSHIIDVHCPFTRDNVRSATASQKAIKVTMKNDQNHAQTARKDEVWKSFGH